MIDQYGEEIYLDLRQYWSLDLVEFIAGEVHSSVRLVLMYLRNLPEGARFPAAVTYDNREIAEQTELPSDPRADAIAEARVWTTDRRLTATLINAVFTNTAVSGNWKNNKPPTFPVVGPPEWQPEALIKSPAAAVVEEPKDLYDVLRKMGWPGGS